MKKFLVISFLLIGLCAFMPKQANAQYGIRLQSEASVTMVGVYVLYSDGWRANILEETNEYYFSPSSTMDIRLPSSGEWTIRLWDRSNVYIITIEVSESSTTYFTITDELLNNSIAE